MRCFRDSLCLLLCVFGKCIVVSILCLVRGVRGVQYVVKPGRWSEVRGVVVFVGCGQMLRLGNGG